MFLLCLILPLALFAKGEDEGEKTYELIVIDSGGLSWNAEAQAYYGYDGTDSANAVVIEEFEAKHPNATVNYLHRDVTQGSMTVDALIAKGQWPDVWIDAGGYFREYLNAETSLPLEDYVDISVFQDDMISPYTRGGNTYAIPASNIATAMAINTSMLDEIGYTMPAQEDWTTDEFLRLAEQLKAAGYPATMVMTRDGFNPWMYPWIYAFGGELFVNGDYSKVAINTPEARAGFEFIKLLVDSGYSQPYPNECDDDIGVELFTTARVFSCMMQNSHADGWIPRQVEEGVIDEIFGYTFVEFPHAPGRAHTPVSAYQTVVNAHNSGDPVRNALAGELAAGFLGPWFLEVYAVITGSFSPLKETEYPVVLGAAGPSYQAIAAVVAESGVMDLGGMNARAKEAMAAAKIPMQRYINGDITVQEFLDIFEADANALLAQ